MMDVLFKITYSKLLVNELYQTYLLVSFANYRTTYAREADWCILKRSKQTDCHGFFGSAHKHIYCCFCFLVAMEHVGGNSDLQKLFEMGKLEEMLLKVVSSSGGASATTTTTTTEL